MSPISIIRVLIILLPGVIFSQEVKIKHLSGPVNSYGSEFNFVQIDENRAYFKVLSYEECLEYVGKCVRLINKLGKKKSIIITVLPIPLAYTFRNKDIIIANRYSKSVLRVAAENVEESYDNVYYFPSFEVVIDCVGWPQAYKGEDKRHVNLDVFSEKIAPLFIEYFCDF